MVKFLTFRRMILPWIVQLVFWVGILLFLVSGILQIYNHQVIRGILVLIVGPILLRMVCELCIIFFRIHDTLLSIDRGLDQRRE